MKQCFDLFLSPSVIHLDIQHILSEDRLLRLHPHWFIEETKPENNGISATLRDYDTDRVFSFHLHLSTTTDSRNPTRTKTIMRIVFTDYDVQELLFFTDQEKTQVQVSYTENKINKQLEKDILLWVRAIQEYLRLYLTTTPRTIFFRLLMNKMILQMNPSQRKICLMITKITVVELLVTIVIVVGYVFFAR